ncbi:MAG TPA: hypothetical protein VIV63_10160 [Steroidobacteraceae bacterium]
MARRKAPAEESPADVAQPVAPRNSRTPVIMWIDDSAVCVEIVDIPVSHPRDGVCRCEACHADLADDWASRFL